MQFILRESYLLNLMFTDSSPDKGRLGGVYIRTKPPSSPLSGGRDSIKLVSQRGDIAIYTAVIVVSIMLAGALAMSTILSRQIPATAQLLQSERAVYAANSGREQALFHIVKQPGITEKEIDSEIRYGANDVATIKGKIGRHATFPLCGLVEGSYAGLKRRFAYAQPEVDCPTP